MHCVNFQHNIVNKLILVQPLVAGNQNSLASDPAMIKYLSENQQIWSTTDIDKIYGYVKFTSEA